MSPGRSLLTDAERAERREFLDGRRVAGIGSSEIHPLLTGGALDVYHAHTRPVTDEDIEGPRSIHLLRGRILEPFVVEMYFRMTGRRGKRERRTITHPDYPGASASLDATIFAEGDRPTGVLEAKAPGLYAWRDLLTTGTRESIVWQLQHLCAVARRPYGAFAFGTLEHEAGPVIPIDVDADWEVGDFCLEVAARFWAAHVVPRVPPDPAEWAALMEKAPRPKIPNVPGERAVMPLDDDQEARSLLADICRLVDVRAEADQGYEATRAMLAKHVETRYPGYRKFEAVGIGKFSHVASRTAGGFDRHLLADHRPIDRDAFIRWCRQRWAGVFNPDEIDRRAEEFADDLTLDLGRFERPGRPYEYWRPTPAKDFREV